MKFRAKMWRYPGQAGWYFVTLPKAKTDKLNKKELASGWGSIRVVATIGKSSWHTSIFPDKKSGSFLLPIKAKIRKIESLGTIKPFTISLGFPEVD